MECMSLLFACLGCVVCVCDYGYVTQRFPTHERPRPTKPRKNAVNRKIGSSPSCARSSRAFGRTVLAPRRTRGKPSRYPMADSRLLLAVLAAILGTLLVERLHHRLLVPTTTSGRAKAVGEKAFVLSVSLQFSDAATSTELLSAWKDAADWCYTHEDFLFAYEVAQSDKDPLKYVIIERYRSKDDYTGAHRTSPAFKRFRPKMRALQESGRVVVTGDSYQELGFGFT